MGEDLLPFGKAGGTICKHLRGGGFALLRGRGLVESKYMDDSLFGAAMLDKDNLPPHRLCSAKVLDGYSSSNNL